MSANNDSIRLNKLLASLGVASRRAIDAFIEEGRITVDGKIATLGASATLEQEVRLDNQVITLYKNDRMLLEVIKYHKPTDLICSRSDPQGRATIFDYLPEPKAGRWVSIGRLDFKTTGLLMLTNDGELAHKMMHPSTQVEREYHVKVQGYCSEALLKQLRHGATLEDGWAKPEHVSILETTQQQHTWLSVVLKEGRNREVRRLFEHFGKTVTKLARVRYGSILLETLPAGHVERLTVQEKQLLLKEMGL